MGAAASKSWVALAGVLVTLATVACAPMLSPAHVATDGDAQIYATVFDRAHEIVVREYYDPEVVQAELEPHTPVFRAAALAASSDREFYAILNDYLFSLGDLHTNARRRAVRGATAGPGIGAFIVRNGSSHVVRWVVPNSPAELAGVEVGWTIDSVAGQAYEPGLIGDQTGPSIEAVFVTPAGERRELRIALSQDWRPSAPSFSNPGGEARVLHMPSFGAGAARDALGFLADIPDDTPLVLDLRGNSGGRQSEFSRLASCFLPRDTVLARIARRDGREIVRRSSGRCSVSWNGPLVVLIDESTVSAGEAFAAAIQDAGRGLIVGRRSGGVALGARELRLPDGGTLNVSVLSVTRPSGVALEGHGVEPDHEAKTTGVDRLTGRDPALEEALRLVLVAADATG